MAATRTPRAFASFVCQSCRQRLLPQGRSFATSSVLRAEDTPAPAPPRKDKAIAGLSALSDDMSRANSRRSGNNNSFNFSSALDGTDGDVHSLLNAQMQENYNAAGSVKPHKMHVFATKHNTHITIVQPPKSAAQSNASSQSATASKASDQTKMVDSLISLSAGNLGFRKAGRGSYDAAYQLTAFVLKQIQERGLLREINQLEVVLRGFGAGREAVTKALLGSEGRNLRGKITAVLDSTRLKLGGPRGRKPRRLG